MSWVLVFFVVSYNTKTFVPTEPSPVYGFKSVEECKVAGETVMRDFYSKSENFNVVKRFSCVEQK